MFCDLLHVKNCFTIKVDHWGLTATKDGKAKLTQELNVDLTNKNVLIVDDIVDTGGTMINVIGELKKQGAKEIIVACTFPLMNGDSINRFHELYQNQQIKAVIGTDSVYHNEKFFELYPWYKEVNVAPLFAKIINTINLRMPISDIVSKR